jgi:uncharacterized protein YggE
MKKLLIITFSLLVSNLYSQNNLSTLAVAGHSQSSDVPDITVLKIDINSKDMDYSKAVMDIKKKSSDLKTFLVSKEV